MFFVSHLYFGRVKRPSSGWMAVTSITHHYYMITNKFENLHALQRKINTRALLPDARPSRPILAVKKVTYIQALRLNRAQPIGPLAFFIPESWFLPGHSVNYVVSRAKNKSIQKIILVSTLKRLQSIREALNNRENPEIPTETIVDLAELVLRNNNFEFIIPPSWSEN